MRVLFIYSEIGVGTQMKMLLEIGVYAAVLKRAGFSTSLLYIKTKKSKSEIAKIIDEAKSDVIVLFSSPEQMSFIKETSKIIKEEFPKIYQICAGLAPTLSPEETITIKSLDAICMGEGENALAEFLSALKTGDNICLIRNFWCKTSSEKVSQQPLRPLEEKLDTLPFSDRDIFNHEKLLIANGKTLFIQAGKGSLYDYEFTHDNALYQLYRNKGIYHRARSPKNIIEEIDKFYDKIKYVAFLDANFIYSFDWLNDFLDVYKKNLDFPFSISAYPSCLNAKIMESLKEAGCTSVTIPIESGNQQIRQSVTQRMLTNDELLSLADEINKHKMELNINLLIGFPQETQKTIAETIAFAKKIRPDNIFYKIYFPIPGTSLYNYCREKGLISRRKFIDLNKDQSVLDLPHLTKEDLSNAYETIHLLANLKNIAHWENAPIGDYNFIGKFSESKTKDTDKTCIRISQFIHHGEKRKVLSQKLNADIRYKIVVGKNQIFVFGILMESEAFLNENLHKIKFQINIEYEGKSQEFFSKTIDKKKIPNNELYWEDYALKFDDEYLNKTVKVIFKIVNEEDNLGNDVWCGWIEPVIINKNRNSDYLNKRFLFISLKEKEVLEKKYVENQKKLDMANAIISKKENENKNLNLEIESRIKRIGEMNKKVMELETQIEEMQGKIDELLVIKDEYSASLSGKMKKMLKGKK